MRQKDSGRACSAVSRTARTTAGWVTTTVRPGRTAAVRSQAPTRSRRSRTDSPPWGFAEGSVVHAASLDTLPPAVPIQIMNGPAAREVADVFDQLAARLEQQLKEGTR